jgi:hypothetical protein
MKLTKYGSFSNVTQSTLTAEFTSGITSTSSSRKVLSISILLSRYQVPTVSVWAVVSVPSKFAESVTRPKKRHPQGLPAAKKSNASAVSDFKSGDHCPFSLSGCSAVWKTVGVIEFMGSACRARIRSLQPYRQKFSEIREKVLELKPNILFVSRTSLPTASLSSQSHFSAASTENEIAH